jgi:hypothetical protein
MPGSSNRRSPDPLLVREDAGASTAQDAPTSHRRHEWACIGGYLVLAAAVSAYVGELLNHDAVSYVSLAQHWLAGRADLAISGTWSPLFVWLLAALIEVTGDVPTSLRLGMAASGLAFLGACLAIYRGVTDRRIARLAGVLTAAFAALFTGTLVTPDLLSAALFLHGFHLFLRNGSGTARNALAAGALLGLAFLAKSVMLPVALGSLLVMSGIAAWRRRSSASVRPGGPIPAAAARPTAEFPARLPRAALFAALAMFAVASPWVAALSIKYGQFAWTRANVPQWVFIGPPGTAQDQPTNIRFIVPEAGRQSQFEDESIVPERSWSPFESRAYLLYYANHVRENVARVPVTLSRFDPSGAALLGLLFLFAVALRRAFRDGYDADWLGWRALAVPTMLTIAAYLPNFADQARYYLVAVPGLYLGALHAWRTLVDVVAQRPMPLGPWLGAGMLAIGLTNLPPMLLPREAESVAVRQGRVVAAALNAAGLAGPVAVVGPSPTKHPGIYLSYFLGTPYHGTSDARTLAAVDRACARLLVTQRGSAGHRLLLQFAARFVAADALSPTVALAMRNQPFAVYVDRAPLDGRACRVARLPSR